MTSAHKMKLFKTIDIENVNSGTKTRKKVVLDVRTIPYDANIVKDKIKFKVIIKEKHILVKTYV